jgi:diacylglycerol O-acyltransferase
LNRLNGLDAGFVYGETLEWHMHAGALFVLDSASPVAGGSARALRDMLTARMHLLGPFRHRLFEPPLRFGLPVWIDTPDMDLDAHIHRVGVPAPGGRREVAELVGELFSTKLSRDRPPWEIWVLEGLEDGRVALLFKVHHSLLDGVRGARLYEVLFDLDPAAPLTRPGGGEAVNESPPSAIEAFVDVARFALGTPGRVLRLAAGLGVATTRLSRLAVSPGGRNVTLPFRAPRTSLNRPLTARRGFAFSSLSLTDVRMVAHAFGVTINDVALAVCAGSLRRYLQDRGGLPARSLVAQIPVGVHRADDRNEGNFVAPTGATLFTDLADPAARLRAIHVSTRSAKAAQAALGDDLVVLALEALPPPLLVAGIGLYRTLGLAERHPPVFNLIVSNVAGPPVPLYFAGARLDATYVLGPLLLGCGLNITLVSYVDRIDFGVATCPEVVEDAWAIADGLPEALEALVKATDELSRQAAAGGPR